MSAPHPNDNEWLLKCRGSCSKVSGTVMAIISRMISLTCIFFYCASPSLHSEHGARQMRDKEHLFWKKKEKKRDTNTIWKVIRQRRGMKKVPSVLLPSQTITRVCVSVTFHPLFWTVLLTPRPPPPLLQHNKTSACTHVTYHQFTLK